MSWGDERGEPRRRGERGGPGGKREIAVGERVCERVEICRAEDPGERLHRKPIRRVSADPAGAVAR